MINETFCSLFQHKIETAAIILFPSHMTWKKYSATFHCTRCSWKAIIQEAEFEVKGVEMELNLCEMKKKMNMSGSIYVNLKWMSCLTIIHFVPKGGWNIKDTDARLIYVTFCNYVSLIPSATKSTL